MGVHCVGCGEELYKGIFYHNKKESKLAFFCFSCAKVVHIKEKELLEKFEKTLADADW